MLSATSHIRIKTEQTRVELLKWLRQRWNLVRWAGGFEKLEGWSLKELSHGEKSRFPVSESPRLL